MKKNYKRIVLSILALIAAGVSPNLFVISQAGYAKLSDLAITFLIPSIILLAVIIAVAFLAGEKPTGKQILTGLAGGAIATIGLEVVREIGFHMGGMPGDMPKLLGVLLLDRFALGPSTWSNIAGWSYHFWNGASFGIIYSLLAGRGNKWYGISFGLLMAIGFMASPVVVALGVGKFGVDYGPGFAITVTLAHIAFGIILGWYVASKNKNCSDIVSIIKSLFLKGGVNCEKSEKIDF